ncbi:MAG: DNA-processing protein DprA [Azoarcus sp.]|jgi:DNA processing protein|nr:DNA-processing protein DprA [Azoarcus sp.]
MVDGLAGWLRLALSPIGAAQQRKLLAAFGLPESVFAQPRNQLAGVVGAEAAEALLKEPHPAALQAALDWAGAPGNHVLTLADADYPKALLEIADPPLVLYVKGNVDLLGREALAIVGSRVPTAQGEINAETFASSLAASDLVIVSGLAQGIDAAAHRGALLAKGGTVAVIGTGIDRIYPARNAALAREIAGKGVVLSEFPLGTTAARWNFPRRNRLIAGLALGVLVVEATTESGSLITARFAAECGREVFAIPGSIHSPQSRGCHRLIREGAKLVETADDVLEELRGISQKPEIKRQKPRYPSKPVSSRKTPSPTSSASLPAHLPPEALRILECLGTRSCDIDALTLETGLPVEALQAHLLTLELESLVIRQPGGSFLRLFI